MSSKRTKISKKKTQASKRRISNPFENLSIKYMALLVLVVLVCSLVVGTIAAITLSSIAYPSGWEVGTSCNRVSVNEIIMYPDTSNSNFINGSYLNSRGGYLKLSDGDAFSLKATHPEYFGSTKISISVDAPYPVIRDINDGTWKTTIDGDPFRTYEKQDTGNPNKWYFYNHYVYFFTIDLQTVGVAEEALNVVWGTCEGLHSLYQRDHEARVRTFSNFGLSPWEVVNGQIYTLNTTAQVEVSDVFYGIMSASVAEVTAGPIASSTGSYDFLWSGSAEAHKDHSGSSLAMWRDDISYEGYAASDGEVPEGTVKYVVPKTIPKDVIVEVSANMEAGLTVNAGTWFGTWADWNVVDNKVRTIVRMDAVYSAGLVTLSGGQDPAGNDTGYYKPDDDVKTTWELLEEEIDAFFTKLGTGFSNLLNESFGPIVAIAVIMVSFVILVICIRIGKK